MPYNIDEIRKNIKKATQGKRVDPDEFKPDKAKNQTEPDLKYRFFVLPPVLEGDNLKSGLVKKSMENFFIAHGEHWVNDKPYSCPRVWDGSHCEICDYGFAMLKECKEQNLGKERKEAIRKVWMPSTYYAVNIFFTGAKCNPEDLRGKVRFYNAPKTILEKWTATLMKDDKGDDEDPSAFGIFFDERAAFVFELQAMKNGQFNEYKTSTFIKNGGVPVPMIVNPETKKADDKMLAALLKARLNLWDKVEEPDPEKIRRLAEVMINGDDSLETSSGGGGFDEDEEQTAPAEEPKKQQAAKTTAAKTAAAKTETKTAAAVKTEAKTAKTSKPIQSREEAKATKKAPPADDDEDAVTSFTDAAEGDDLSNEVSVDDADTSSSEADSSDDTAAAGSDDDVDSGDIANLLSQLDD